MKKCDFCGNVISSNLIRYHGYQLCSDICKRYLMKYWRNPKSTMPAKVPCFRCKNLIPANSIRCPSCQVHFSGKACEFAPSPKDSSHRTSTRRWYQQEIFLVPIIVIGIFVLLVIFLFLVGYR